jgi:putative oxidoreductase
MPTRTLYDVAALIARLGLGAVVTAHGWHKIRVGVDDTTQSFRGMKIPLPELAAVYSTFVELLGGVMLIVGFGLPVAGLLLFLDAAGAFAIAPADLSATAQAIADSRELALVVGLTALLFACGGGGRVTLDQLLFARRPARQRAGGAAGPGDRTDPATNKKSRKKDDPAASWVADLPEERPLEYRRTSSATTPAKSQDVPASPRLTSEITDSAAGDVLVSGKKTPRGRSSGTATRKGAGGGTAAKTSRTGKGSGSRRSSGTSAKPND